ncbi:hypothetical protein C5S42_00235 [Candidatus Methanomarinus sp.]|nr:hypothetical protein C5S42_00235 [ANME-2 cluster archaeon]
MDKEQNLPSVISGIITVSAVIIILVFGLPVIFEPAFKYIGNMSPEEFTNGETKKDYVYLRDCNGQYHITDGSMLMSGTISVINTNVVWDEPDCWFYFLIENGEFAKIEVTFRNETKECSFGFLIDGSSGLPQKAEFGINVNNLPYVKTNNGYLKPEIPKCYFDPTGDIYDIIVKFHAPTPNSSGYYQLEIYEINIGG